MHFGVTSRAGVRVSFAILGCGRIGRMHARNIKAHPRAELVGVYDVFAKAAEEGGNELRAKVLGSVDEALNDSKIDRVFIASSTDTHVDLITRAAVSRSAMPTRPISKPVAIWALPTPSVRCSTPATSLLLAMTRPPFQRSGRSASTTSTPRTSALM